MGAQPFYQYGYGKTPREAFNNCVLEAINLYGNQGYTGTIAEKESFVIISLPEGQDPWSYAYHMIEIGDPRIDDKWGPAGCIKVPNEKDKYLFFGWSPT